MLLSCVYLHCNVPWLVHNIQLYIHYQLWFGLGFPFQFDTKFSFSLFPSLPPSVVDCTSILAVGTFHPSLADGQPGLVTTHCQGRTRPSAPLVPVPARLHGVSTSATPHYQNLALCQVPNILPSVFSGTRQITSLSSATQNALGKRKHSAKKLFIECFIFGTRKRALCRVFFFQH
jgi:hypothetical protein